MTKNDAEYESVHRLLSVDWNSFCEKDRSHVALVREYLRRTALWAKCLEATEAWPFFDVAGYIAPEVRAAKDNCS
jgi:hypothetical protein